MSGEILVIGSLNMDLSVSAERLPKAGETVMGTGVVYSPGGKGANQAGAAGRLGGRVKMLGCVGRDSFGETQVAALRDCGVDTSNIRRSASLATGMAVIEVDAKGSNRIVVIQGANGECSAALMKESEGLFAGADYILLQLEIPQEAVACAVKIAKKLGKTVILNPAPAPERIGDGILRGTDYLTPNETELSRIAGIAVRDRDTAIEGARRLIERGVKNVVVTLGEQGALLVNSERAVLFPARKVEAVDTTAAGDCFNGAFVTALSEGKSAEEAAAFANLASSIAVTGRGALESLPHRQEVEALAGERLRPQEQSPLLRI